MDCGTVGVTKHAITSMFRMSPLHSLRRRFPMVCDVSTSDSASSNLKAERSLREDDIQAMRFHVRC
eukprot:5179955-Lingulodinium_polyedra.AAC.1